MAKILLMHYSGVFKTGRYRSTVFYDGLIRALERNGNHVLHIITNDYLQFPWNGDNKLIWGVNKKKLLKRIKKFEPDLVLSLNNSAPEGLEDELDCPFAVWDADSVNFFSGKENIVNKSSRYTFLGFSEEGCQSYVDFFGADKKNVHLLRTATDLNADRGVRKEYNISFIGSNFKTPPFFQSEISKNRKVIKEVIGKVKDNSLYFEDLSKEFPQMDFAQSDLFGTLSGNNRVKILDFVSDLGLELFGSANWNQVSDYSLYLAACYNSRLVFSADHNEEIYNKSKVCLNISHMQAVSNFPWRVMDILATDGCLVSDKKGDISKFIRGVDVPMFESFQEAREVCEKILKNENLRSDIVCSANEFVEKNGRFEHRFKDLEQIFSLRILNQGEKGTVERLYPEEFMLSHYNALYFLQRKLIDMLPASTYRPLYTIAKHAGISISGSNVIYARDKYEGKRIEYS